MVNKTAQAQLEQLISIVNEIDITLSNNVEKLPAGVGKILETMVNSGLAYAIQAMFQVLSVLKHHLIFCDRLNNGVKK